MRKSADEHFNQNVRIFMDNWWDVRGKRGEELNVYDNPKGKKILKVFVFVASRYV